MQRQLGTHALDLLKDASCTTASSDRQGGVRRAGRLFELSIRKVGHGELAQRSRAVSLVDRWQCAKGVLVQRDRLLRLAGRQPAACALTLDVARRAVPGMPTVHVALR